ncbi:MAG TPA: alpha-N-arabinofuranosidase, partial [Acidimicrobiia bacterium]|nr:alpha-N-arabinofuranosidase [Acidimicrobiia bacterium]
MRASIVLDPESVVGPVRPRLFGSFVEHLGRCVYTGIFEPGHPLADQSGMRKDVADLVRELGVTVVRYPGGNFVSGYRWEDGVGPVSERPRRLDTAWHSLEPNTFGVGEFMEWANLVGVEPMLALNLGTRGVAEALDLLEYCNHPDGTLLSDLRISHGYPEPFGVDLWCLGNELDGPWQLGHKTPEEYGRLAEETARAMRMLDSSLELVACGSSYSGMPTFGVWEETVLRHAFDHIDYISLHAYYEPRDGDIDSFLASSIDMDTFIKEVAAIADRVAAEKGSNKRIDLSFDEWNVWYVSRFQEEGPPTGWPEAPHLIEDTYNVTDAVVVGSLLITLLRNADRVAAACLAQLVNAIAPIRAEPGGPAWRQTTFFPFAQTAALARGDVLSVTTDAPSYHSEQHGEAPVVDAVATHDSETGEVALFVVNRSTREEVSLSVTSAAYPTLLSVEHTVLADNDITATNSAEQPERVVPSAART